MHFLLIFFPRSNTNYVVSEKGKIGLRQLVLQIDGKGGLGGPDGPRDLGGPPCPSCPGRPITIQRQRQIQIQIQRQTHLLGYATD